MFFTIQGEGPRAGHRSVFVRLAGCNLQCPGCDTEYTVGRETWITRHLVLAVDDLAKRNNAAGCLVVITGGEPLRQPLGELCLGLLNFGYEVQIETNGFFAPDDTTLRLAQTRDIMLVVSPKTGRINQQTAEAAWAFKYVLDHRSVAEDGLPIRALGHVAPNWGVARPPARPKGHKIPVYLNPFDSGDVMDNALNLEAVARSCKAHGYILGVQLHKLAGLE